MKKKILYFMPDSPTDGKSGNSTRSGQLLDYLQRLFDVYEVDFLSCPDWGIWDQEGINRFKSKYANVNLILRNRRGYTKKEILKYFFFYKIPNLFYRLFNAHNINISGPLLQRQVADIINRKRYDIVIISYASFGRLIDRVKVKHKPYYIMDTHDFMTVQNKAKGHRIGAMLQEEIDILKKYDEIWTYSVEEAYIFDQLTDRKVSLIPISFPDRHSEKKPHHKYDVIYVASENTHNIKGAQWLIDEVLHHIPDITVHVIGKVCAEIADAPNLVKHGVVDDITSYYREARVAICPMLSGTGIKIKVLEALSFGLPVVTNRRGVDGLINKVANGCLVYEKGEEFAKSIKNLVNNDILYEQTRTEAISYFGKNHLPEIEKEMLDNIFLHELQTAGEER